ncbi:hypothetical protein [Sphingomonas sp. dw_22]|uniref:hypothetical protein n=1 Tax=Sphingomonas sp. dw_22 TaxID=2721175 RepID=UPI001BD48E6B|nr:hypothetical protein [Sphingomonas sp. dw_22]
MKPRRIFWTGTPSRFAALSRNKARLALLALVLLLAACLSALSVPQSATGASASGVDQEMTDLALYERVSAGVKGGDNYYVSAATALRAGRYPLRPFLTFRLPALAVIQAAIPEWATNAMLFALVLATMIAWGARLGAALPRWLPRVATLLLMLGSLIAFLQSELAAFHEIWAGLLVALSLALRRPGRWIEAVAIGLAAMLIRETAALYVVVMALMAWLEGQKREALGWGAALLVFAAVLGVHAYAVSGVTGPLDARSPGWLGLNGFGFFVESLSVSTALQILPLWIAALLVGLSLFGWASWNDSLGLRMFVLLAVYALAIGLFARLDTFYWALMIAPVSLVGLVFVPDALRDLFVRALDRRRITVTKVTR